MGYGVKRKGRMMYVPPNVIVALEDLQKEDGIKVRADAFNEFTKYAEVGREAKRLMTFGYDWSKKKKRK